MLTEARRRRIDWWQGGSQITPSQLLLTTFTSNSVQKPLLVYNPPGSQSTDNLPIIIFAHGDGAKGATVTVAAQAVGTGDGVTVTFPGTFTNIASSQVLYSSVVIKVGGVEVARGKANGTIIGNGVSGTMSHELLTANSPFSVTFATAPANAAAITIDYQYSKIFETGFPMFLNSGDEPVGVRIFCPQLPASGQNDFNLSWDFDQLLTYVETNYPNYNQNRIYVTGLSRGAFFCRELMQARHTIGATKAIAATIPVATNWETMPWASLTDIGVFFIQGLNDTTAFYSIDSYLNEANANTLNIHPEAHAIFNGGHASVVWNDNCYNRKERTDTAGLAKFDFVRWLKKFSKDQTERSTLHVQAAEYSVDFDDYMRALLQVNALGSGDTKTALLARLAAIKAAIGTIYIIDFGDPAATSSGNINNMTSLGTGAVLSNIIDDTGVESVYDVTIVSQFTTNATKHINEVRGAGNYHGLPATLNRDRAEALTTVTTGQLKISSLEGGSQKFTVLVYGFSYQSGSTTEALFTTSIGGVVKSLYTEVNTFYKIEYKDLLSASAEIVIDGDANSTRGSGFSAIVLIKQP